MAKYQTKDEKIMTKLHLSKNVENRLKVIPEIWSKFIFINEFRPGS